MTIRILADIPQARVGPINADGTWNMGWYNFFASLRQRTGGPIDQVHATADDVDSVAGADVLLRTETAVLPAARVVTDTAAITWDWTLDGVVTAVFTGVIDVDLVRDGKAVLKAQKAGWAPWSGTDDRATHATYTAPTISNPPTQAEVQALAAALQNVSRGFKALVDDLHATAGHGLIGT